MINEIDGDLSAVKSDIFLQKENRKNITFSIGEIGDLEIKVENIEKASRFYESKLDINVCFKNDKSALCDCRGVRFMLSKASNRKQHSVLHFKVDDIQSAFELLKGRGVEFYGSPKAVVSVPGYSLWFVFFHDIDKNLLSLMSECHSYGADEFQTIDGLGFPPRLDVCVQP